MIQVVPVRQLRTIGFYLKKIVLILTISFSLTAWKVSKYGVFSGPYFPVFGLNTGIYAVNLRIQSEYRKMRTRKTPYLETFHAVTVHNDASEY